MWPLVGTGYPAACSRGRDGEGREVLVEVPGRGGRGACCARTAACSELAVGQDGREGNPLRRGPLACGSNVRLASNCMARCRRGRVRMSDHESVEADGALVAGNWG